MTAQDQAKLIADTIAQEIAEGELDPNDTAALEKRRKELEAAATA